MWKAPQYSHGEPGYLNTREERQENTGRTRERDADKGKNDERVNDVDIRKMNMY